MKKIVYALLMAGALALGTVSVTSNAWATASAGCRLVADNTTQSGNSVYAHGGRQDCGNTANVAVALYKDISFFPDTREASSYDTDVMNIYRSPGASCDGNDPYYTTVNSSTGASLEGAHITQC